jgi:UDP-glucose 4-epimerase
VPRFIRAALLDEPLVVFGDGTQTRDFTYVEDVCAAIVRCIKERTCSPSPVNLAFGGRTSIQALVRLVSTAVGRTIEIHYEPERPGDVRDSQADPAVLESLLPALPQTPLEDAIQETASWMRSELNRI